MMCPSRIINNLFEKLIVFIVGLLIICWVKVYILFYHIHTFLLKNVTVSFLDKKVTQVKILICPNMLLIRK